MYEMIYSKVFFENNQELMKYWKENLNKRDNYAELIRELIIIDIIKLNEKKVETTEIQKIWLEFVLDNKIIFPDYFYEKEDKSPSKIKFRTKIVNITSSNANNKQGLKKRKELKFLKEGGKVKYYASEEFYFDLKEKNTNVLSKILFTQKYPLFYNIVKLTKGKIKISCDFCEHNKAKVFFVDSNNIDFAKMLYICKSCLENKVMGGFKNGGVE